MEKIRVEFLGGEARNAFNGECNYMLATIERNTVDEDGYEDKECIELYDEVYCNDFTPDFDEENEEWDCIAFDEYSYPILKESIIKQAKEAGIDPEILEFPYDE